MFLNTTTGLWQFWLSGEYYDYTSEVCRSWAGKCTGIWQYQPQCFVCPSGEFYDLELMTWVSSCGSSKIQLSNSQYSIIGIWRSPNIYIDPQVSQIIELGTQKYPYRHIGLAFSEILNQFSHQNLNITLYIKENSSVRIQDSTAFILNITSVTVNTYSDSSNFPQSSTITPVSYALSLNNAKAQFSILSNSSLNLSNVISVGSFTTLEKNSLNRGRTTFIVCRSNFQLININGYRDSSNINVNTYFIFFWSQDSHSINIFNSSLSITGSIFKTYDPANINFKNVTIDATRIIDGISFEIDWNSPDSDLTTEINFSNITVFILGVRTIYGWPRIIYYQGPGNFSASNLDFSNYYSNYADGRATIMISSSPNCQPNDGVVQNINITNGLFTLNKYSEYLTIYNSLELALDYNIYRKTIVNILNQNFINYTNAFGPMILATGSIGDEIYYLNSYNYNFQSSFQLVGFSNFDKAIVTNITYLNGNEIVDHILDFSNNGYITIDTLVLLNLNISRSSLINLINLDNYETTYTLIRGLNATNIQTNFGLILSSVVRLNQIIIVNWYFSHISVDFDASVLFVDNSKSVIMENIVIDYVTLINPIDDDSSFMHILNLDLSGNLNTTVRNITYTNSQSSFIHFLSMKNDPTQDIYITLENVSFINMSYPVERSIWEVDQIVKEANVYFIFSNFTTDNIVFKTHGRIIKFGQHLLVPVLISNSTFTNLYSCSLEVHPEAAESSRLRTKLRIENTVFNNINEGFESLIKIFKGSSLEIYNSTFTNIFTYEDAWILFADSSDTNIFIYDSVFKNNTAFDASLFTLDFNSVLKCNNWTIMYNFAVIYGIALITGGSSIQFYNSKISNNYGIQDPVWFFIDGISTSIFDSWTISSNYALSSAEVNSEFFEICTKLCFVPAAFISYIQENPQLLNYKKSNAIFEILGTTVLFQNNTRISNQNALLVAVDSTINFSDSNIYNLSLFETGIQIISTSLIIQNSTVYNITSQNLNFIQTLLDCSITISLSKTYFTNNSKFHSL